MKLVNIADVEKIINDLGKSLNINSTICKELLNQLPVIVDADKTTDISQIDTLFVGKKIMNVDFNTLPIGTKFYVYNEAWNGRIEKKDNNKCIHVLATDNFIKIKKENSALLEYNIKIIELPKTIEKIETNIDLDEDIER